MNRREFVAGAAAAQLAQAQPKRPNILFLMVDEMRWDAMRCAGHGIVETPNLDKLARQATRFTHAYTVSPVCCPSRACTFSGRYAHVNGVESNGFPAHNGEIFLPTILRHHGYHTAISGKLHYTPKRFDYGFDQFWTFSNEGPTPDKGYMAYLQQKHGSPAKWLIVDGTCPWPDDPLGRDVGLFRYGTEDFETEWITERSLEYIRSRKSAQQPWFLFTSYLKPHSPSVEPNPWFSKYDAGAMPVPKLPPNAREIRAAQPVRRRRAFVDDERMIRTMTALYYAAISHVDQQVGRILAELDRNGMADNTLVLFTADHGNMLADRGRWFKDLMYDGSARVPLIWRNPRQKTGRVRDQVIENTDLMPSILEAAGLPAPEGVQGRSFLKLANGEKDPGWKNTCFSQLSQSMWWEGGYKFIDNSRDLSGTRELYDMRNDPEEQRNLADDPKHRDRARHAAERLTATRALKPPPVRVAGLSTPAYAEVPLAEREQSLREAPANNADTANRIPRRAKQD